MALVVWGFTHPHDVYDLIVRPDNGDVRVAQESARVDLLITIPFACAGALASAFFVVWRLRAGKTATAPAWLWLVIASTVFPFLRLPG
ncbi:MAG TPA: hypothetical protein VGF45_03420, partial [Polyangia bacterium]